jgi:hypothetical protein
LLVLLNRYLKQVPKARRVTCGRALVSNLAPQKKKRGREERTGQEKREEKREEEKRGEKKKITRL